MLRIWWARCCPPPMQWFTLLQEHSGTLSKPQTPHEIWARIYKSVLWLRRPKSNNGRLVVVVLNTALPNLRHLLFLLPQLVLTEWMARSSGQWEFFFPIGIISIVERTLQVLILHFSLPWPWTHQLLENIGWKPNKTKDIYQIRLIN